MATLNKKWVLWHRLRWGAFVTGSGRKQASHNGFIQNLTDLEADKEGFRKNQFKIKNRLQ